MKRYVYIVILIIVLFIGRNYLRNFVYDIIGHLTNKNITIIYADSATQERINALNNDIQELNNLLKLNNNLSTYDFVNATTITRNTESWYNFFVVDKGFDDAIEKGMAVVTDKGLVGIVDDVKEKYSRVRLLTSNDVGNKISVSINHDGNYIYCFLDSFNGRYVLKGISDIMEITKGDVVTTSGLGQFPSGLVIGYVDEIEYDNYELDKTVYVNPIAGINNITYVSIIRKDL